MMQHDYICLHDRMTVEWKEGAYISLRKSIFFVNNFIEIFFSVTFLLQMKT